MHKAKGLYGDGRLPMSSRTRRIASLRGLMVLWKCAQGVTVVIADAKNRVPTGLVRLAGRESMVLRKYVKELPVSLWTRRIASLWGWCDWLDVNRWR